MLIILNTPLLHEYKLLSSRTKSDEYIKKCTFTNILKINYVSVFTGFLKLKTILQEMRIYSRTCTNDHLSKTTNSLQWPLFWGADSPYIDSCLNLSTTATFCCPQSGCCSSSLVRVTPSHKGFIGTCGQSGYVFRDFCLK